MANYLNQSKGQDIIAIDGKTMKGSRDRTKGKILSML